MSFFSINSGQLIQIFNRAITDYHIFDNINHEVTFPVEFNHFDQLLYRKCWIDTVQWHLEDLIRDPEIDPAEALAIKRKIDSSNQTRTDLVEQIDEFLIKNLHSEKIKEDSRINTESPGWAIDRLSILLLKIYHMEEQVNRKKTTEIFQAEVANKLYILLNQKTDLSTAIDQLIEDVLSGKRVVRTYRQMKMYNDDNLNPILYRKNSGS